MSEHVKVVKSNRMGPHLPWCVQVFDGEPFGFWTDRSTAEACAEGYRKVVRQAMIVLCKHIMREYADDLDIGLSCALLRLEAGGELEEK